MKRIDDFPAVAQTSRELARAVMDKFPDVYVGVRGANAVGDGASEPERFLVVVNWFTELRERMGGS